MDKDLLPLKLDNIKILNVVADHEAEILYVEVQTTEDSTNCHKCGKQISRRHGSDRERKIQHLPSVGYQLYITYKPNRYICNDCDEHPTTTAVPNWHKRNSNYSIDYEENILLSMINSTVVDVSKKEQLTEDEILGILDRHCESSVNWKSIDYLGIIGIDEIAIKKGYKDYVTIITSRVNGKNRLLAILSGRKKITIKAFLKKIPSRLAKTIAGFCVDMYSGFIGAIREVFKGKAIIIIDRFHVAKLYRAELDKFRQKVIQRLKRELTTKEYDALKNATNLLKKKKEYLTKKDKVILDNLFTYAPELAEAYHCAIKLTSIFNTHMSQEEGMAAFDDWIKLVRKRKVKCFNKFIGTLKRYKTEVANYFIDRNTSAFVEGLNNKVKVLKRRCYGIYNLKHMFQRLHLDMSGYEILLSKSAC